jgi:esterase
LIRRIFPSATVQPIRDAGHWVHAEAPEEFLRVANEFLLMNQ